MSEYPSYPTENEQIRIKTLILGETIKHENISKGTTIDDWLRARGLPDVLMAQGISIKVNGEDRATSYVLKANDSVVISPKKAEGGY